MNRKNRYRIRSKRIRSLHDLELEKSRLQLEIVRSEEAIRSGYRQILQALSFRNLANTILEEVTTTSTVLSKAFSIGKSLLERRKKKKKDKARMAAAAVPHEETRDNPPGPQS